MTDWVRVHDDRTGVEYTTTPAILAAYPDHLTKADGGATDRNGNPLPPTYPKPRVPLGTKAPTKS